MGAQKNNNKNKILKHVVSSILLIVVFFTCDGPQTTAQWLDFFNIPVPEILVNLQQKQKSETELKIKEPVELTEQQLEERDSLRKELIKKKAREDGLDPNHTYEAYMCAKYYVEECYIISENHLYERLRQLEFKQNEIYVAISWLINFNEVEYNKKRHTYKMKYE